jgi:hypothetical protein
MAWYFLPEFSPGYFAAVEGMQDEEAQRVSDLLMRPIASRECDQAVPPKSMIRNSCFQ